MEREGARLGSSSPDLLGLSMEQRRQAEPRPPRVPHAQPPKLQVEDDGEHRQTQAQTAPPPAGASSNKAEEAHARSRNSTGRSFSFGFWPSHSPLVAGPWGRAREGVAARRGDADTSAGPRGGSWLGGGGRRAGAGRRGGGSYGAFDQSKGTKGRYTARRCLIFAVRRTLEG